VASLGTVEGDGKIKAKKEALAETIRLMGEIDTAIEAHGGWPISNP